MQRAEIGTVEQLRLTSQGTVLGPSRLHISPPDHLQHRLTPVSQRDTRRAYPRQHSARPPDSLHPARVIGKSQVLGTATARLGTEQRWNAYEVQYRPSRTFCCTISFNCFELPFCAFRRIYHHSFLVGTSLNLKRSKVLQLSPPPAKISMSLLLYSLLSATR
jgi:hypothetical protein